MTTHAAYPTLDSSKLAATYSRKIAHTLLRTKLGFKGVLISDDLCMGAVTRRRGVPQAAVDALRAGHDLLILADDQALQKKTANAVKRALSQNKIPPKQQQESRKRLTQLMHRFARPPVGPLSKPNHRLAKQIATRAVRILQKGNTALPLPLKKQTTLNIYWPDMHALKHRFVFEGGPKGPLTRLRKHIARWPGKKRYKTTPLSAFKADTLPRADFSLFFCFDARFFPAERAALKHVQSRSKNVIVLLMRNPWDRTYLKPGTTALTAYGFRNCQIDALLEALR
jgi:beta-glucosidase-like glycosyl hydrolase